MTLKLRHTILLAVFVLIGCGGSVIPENPINDLRDQYLNEYQYSIILNDMDLEGNQYKHKYKIMKIKKDGSVSFDYTEWRSVDDYFFELHEPNLGMQILSKNEEGIYNNLATPPGFQFIVGNQKYGAWKRAPNEVFLSDDEIWKFNEKYIDLNKKLELEQVKVTRAEFDQFNKKYAYNRPFYGQKYHKDSSKYGTYSRHWIIMRPLFYQRRFTKGYFNKNTFGSGGGNRGGGGFGK